MNKTYYVCKYTPIELLESLGGECENFNHMPDGFDLADQVSHPNICGFGKTLLEGVMEGKIKELQKIKNKIYPCSKDSLDHSIYHGIYYL